MEKTETETKRRRTIDSFHLNKWRRKKRKVFAVFNSQVRPGVGGSVEKHDMQRTSIIKDTPTMVGWKDE